MAFSNPARSITWPPGAGTGEMRMVAGADTPIELQSYGIQVALLFYVTKVETGEELGYFFIGLSNILDIGNDEACLFGSVIYPVAGDPSSPTASDVKTHHQMSWDTESTIKWTVFKDNRVQFNTSVTNVNFFQRVNFFSDLAISGHIDQSGAPTKDTRVGQDLYVGRHQFFTGDLVSSGNSFLNNQTTADTLLVAELQPVLVEETTDDAGWTTTAFAAPTPAAGTTFVAPLSGKVTIDWSVFGETNTAGVDARWTLELREGSTIGSGVVVVAASNNYVIITDGRIAAGNSRVVSGLTQGATYNVRILQRISAAGNADTFFQAITVYPQPG